MQTLASMNLAGTRPSPRIPARNPTSAPMSTAAARAVAGGTRLSPVRVPPGTSGKPYPTEPLPELAATAKPTSGAAAGEKVPYLDGWVMRTPDGGVRVHGFQACAAFRREVTVRAREAGQATREVR